MLKPKVSLIASCPCGSDRKYKNCCWKLENREYAQGRSAVSEVINNVFAFVNKNYKDEMATLVDKVMSSTCYGYNHEFLMEAFEKIDPFISIVFDDVGVADYILEPKKTAIDLFLEEKRDSLHPMAVEFLQGWRNAGITLYRVKGVDFRKSMTVIDLFSKETMTVSDSHLCDVFEREDTFFARVVRMSAEYLFSPAILPVHPLRAYEILEEFREEKDSIPRSKTITWRRFFKKNWEKIPECWLADELTYARDPVIINTDKNPFA